MSTNTASLPKEESTPIKAALYWRVLTISMVVTTLLLFLAIGINIMDYTAPVAEQTEVVYQKAYGLFGPIFYGAEHVV